MFPDNLLYKLITDVLGNHVVEEYKDSYSKRLMVQKLIYIFQGLNDVEGYDFGWYLAGPYSTELTTQMYNKISNVSEVKKHKWDELQFNGKGKEFVERTKQFFAVDEGELGKENLSKAAWFELLASLFYLKKRDNVQSKEELVKALLAAKNKFSRQQIEFAIKERAEWLEIQV